MARQADIDVFSPYNVMDALHVSYGRKKNEKIPCPVCRKKTFFMNMENGLGHCFRASCDFKANHTGYYAASMGIDLEEAREQMYNYMGVPFQKKGSAGKPNIPTESRRERKAATFEKEAEIVSINIRDKVNREIVSSHGLIDRHVNDMIKRGLTKEEVASLGYASFGYHDEAALSHSYKDKGLELRGVPGFFLNDDGFYQLRQLKKGILVPFKDSQNRIQGFQLRKNNEDLKTWMENGEKKKENKCNWLSSTGLKEGTHIPAYCHYACDFVYDFCMDRVVPVIKNNTITVTEGGMKGDIAHVLSGRSIIALPGVNALDEFKKELPFLKEMGVTKIVDAFDMDFVTNENVAKQRQRLKELIEESGFEYVLETWDVTAENHSDLKGIDDYYAYYVRGV